MNDILALLSGLAGYGRGRQNLLADRENKAISAATAARAQSNLDRTYNFELTKQQQQAALDAQKEADQRTYWDNLTKGAADERTNTTEQNRRVGGSKFPEYIAGFDPKDQPVATQQYNSLWGTSYPVPGAELTAPKTIPGTPASVGAADKQYDDQLNGILGLLTPQAGGPTGFPRISVPPMTAATPQQDIPGTYVQPYGPGPKDRAAIKQSNSAANYSDTLAGVAPINANTAAQRATTEAKAAEWLHGDKALELKLREYGIKSVADSARLARLVQTYGIDTTASTAANRMRVDMMLADLSAATAHEGHQVAADGNTLQYLASTAGKGPQRDPVKEKADNLKRLSDLSYQLTAPKPAGKTDLEHAKDMNDIQNERAWLQQRNTAIDEQLKKGGTPSGFALPNGLPPLSFPNGLYGIKAAPIAVGAKVKPAGLGPLPTGGTRDYNIGGTSVKITRRK